MCGDVALPPAEEVNEVDDLEAVVLNELRGPLTPEPIRQARDPGPLRDPCDELVGPASAQPSPRPPRAWE